MRIKRQYIDNQGRIDRDSWFEIQGPSQGIIGIYLTDADKTLIAAMAPEARVYTTYDESIDASEAEHWCQQFRSEVENPDLHEQLRRKEQDLEDAQSKIRSLTEEAKRLKETNERMAQRLKAEDAAVEAGK